MAICLVVDELTDQSAGVSKDHLSLAHSLVVEKLPFIEVPIAEMMLTTAVSLSALDVSLVVVPVCILNTVEPMDHYKYLHSSITDAPVTEGGFDYFTWRSEDDASAIDLIFAPVTLVDYSCCFEIAKAKPAPLV